MCVGGCCVDCRGGGGAFEVKFRRPNCRICLRHVSGIRNRGLVGFERVTVAEVDDGGLGSRN